MEDININNIESSGQEPSKKTPSRILKGKNALNADGAVCVSGNSRTGKTASSMKYTTATPVVRS